MELIVNEEKIFYMQSNLTDTGNSILFIHGAGMSCASMSLFFEDLSNYNCIAVDLPCHGGSLGRNLKTIEEYADLLEDVIKAFHLQGIISGELIVAGYSMGGCIALDLAIRRAEYVKGIVVLDSGAGLTGKVPLLEKAGQLTPETIDITKIFMECFGTNSTPAFKRFLLDTSILTKPSDAVCFNDLSTALSYDKLEECRRIDIPVLVLSGAEDKIIPLRCSIDLWETIPDCAFGVMPYLGHSGIFEYKEFVVKAVEDFIRNSRLFSES